MDTLTVNQKVIIAFVVGLIIGGGAVGLFTLATGPEGNTASVSEGLSDRDKNGGMMEEESEEQNGEEVNDGGTIDTGPTDAVEIGRYSLSVSDQASGGNVRIDSVSAPESVWVAIHEDLNGDLGNVLGARWFPAGEGAGEVRLLRATAPGALYYAVLYRDAHDDHLFELNTDPQITGADDNALVRVFQTTTN